LDFSDSSVFIQFPLPFKKKEKKNLNLNSFLHYKDSFKTCQANVAISHSQTMTTATNVNTLHLTPEKFAVKNIHLNSEV